MTSSALAVRLDDAAFATSVARTQGGDLRGLPGGGDLIDLGTCVNRYGPAPGVRPMLAELDPGELRAHPYEAAELFVSTYAEYLGVAEKHLVPGRGITEFLWTLKQILPPGRVAAVTPDYTDIVNGFANHLAPEKAVDTVAHRLARVARAMRDYAWVVISNPNNPLGLYLPYDELVAVCRDNPQSVLVVDESYLDFTVDHHRLSMMRSGLPNLAVLRSPTKLFGIAGVRTGALWTRHDDLRGRVRAHQMTWPISHIDAMVAVTSLRSVEWVDGSRRRLLADAARMERTLVEHFPQTVTGVPAHYRFVPADRPQDLYRLFLDAGLVVRPFTTAERGRVAGVRIATPITGEHERFAAALDGVRR